MSVPVEAPVESPRDEDLPIPEHLRSAWSVLIGGLRLSPELRKGLGLTVAVSLGAVVGNLVVPILVQQIFDHGFRGGFRPAFVFGLCGAAFALVLVAFLAGRAAARRLVRASEEALMELRVRGFEHIHRLSIATQSRERRGVFVARVTADVDTLSKFTEEGGIEWIWAVVQITLTLVIMLFYSWQLTIPVVLLVAPLLLVMGTLQAKMSEAYDLVRGRVGEMLSEVSESVMGADVVRAYGLEDRVDARVKRSIRDRYRAHVLAHLRTARLWPMGTLFWGVALSTVIFVGVTFGPEWGLTFGKVSAFLFLADLFLHPFTDLPEIYAETQTAIAGWRKILALLELPVEIAEPSPGVALGAGALAVHADGVSYRYADGPLVLKDVSIEVPAGAHVAVVGETGSGKTTFCKLLTRLADPVEGRIDLEGDRPPRGAARVAAVGGPDGSAGRVPVRPHGARERPRRPRGSHRPRDRDGVRRARPRRLGRVAPPRTRHEGRRARRIALGRRAPARVARASADREPGRADPGRGDERGGSGDRTEDLRGAPARLGRPDDDHHRPPAEHRGGRRRDLRLRRRAHRRTRQSR